MAFGHPNYTKVYGFFSDKDNFYIIREFLEEGDLLESKKAMNENAISQSLNHIIFAASCLSSLIDVRFWKIDV